MADVVRLSIVYDTQQAAAQLTQLNARGAQLASTTNKLSAAAGVSTGRLRNMALAGVRLSSALAGGNVSAASLAGSVSRLAGASVIGAAVVSVLNLVNAFQEFKKISKDIENTIDEMQTSARDASKDVQRLLGEVPQGESPAERAVKRLRDAAAQLRKEATRLGGPAGALLESQAADLEAQVPGVGARAAKGAASAERRRLAEATKDYNKSLQDSNTILGLLNAGPLEQMNATMRIMEKRLQFLVENGKEAGDEAQQLALLLGIGAEKMREMERSLNLLRDGLFTAADAIEEFVVTGTFAFTDFLNNIIRLLYRDFTGELIGGILHSAAGTVGKGSVTTPGPEQVGVSPSGISPSVAIAGPNFTIHAMDSQDVSRWVERNGPMIAGEMARQFGRSANMRRAMRRG